MKEEKEIKSGKKLAWQFKPFLTTPPESMNDVDLTVIDMEKAIDRLIEKKLEPFKEFEDRVKQLLSALDYSKLSDYQAKVVLLLEEKMKIKPSVSTD